LENRSHDDFGIQLDRSSAGELFFRAQQKLFSMHFD
jgi:hypothetical protein